MNLLERKVIITDKESIYYNEWGIIKHFDGNHFHIAIANSSSQSAIFERSEFRVRRV